MITLLADVVLTPEELRIPAGTVVSDPALVTRIMRSRRAILVEAQLDESQLDDAAIGADEE